MAPPEEYVRFTQRRRLWQELGIHMDDMEHMDFMEATTFFRIEDHYRARDTEKS